MPEGVSIKIDPNTYQSLINKYGNEKVEQIIGITHTFSQKVQAEAREILKSQGKVDSGTLINRIKYQVNMYNNRVVGQVYAGTKYARFIHEGAKHKGSEITPFFVSFNTAPSLRQWAIRKGVLYQKRKDGQIRKTKKSGDKWYITSSKTRKEYSVNIKTGGMKVKIEPIKYLEIPFEKYVDQYIHKVSKVMT